MVFRELMMKATAKIADLTFDKNLQSQRDKARNDGYQVTFEGEYQQARKGQPKTKIRVPFVVAQDEGQRAKLAEGTLEGRVYDMRRYATIHGKIDGSSVRFGKLYEPSSVDNPEFIRQGIATIEAVLQAAGEPSTVKYDSLVNPHVIVYQGRGAIEDSAYSGKWHFKSDNADMEQEGAFSMKATHPLAINLFCRS